MKSGQFCIISKGMKQFHMELKDTGEQVGSIGYTVEDNTPIGKLVHIDHEWHDGKMKTRLEYRLLKSEWESSHN